MTRPLLPATFTLAVLLSASADAHGGNLRGPRYTVPIRAVDGGSCLASPNAKPPASPSYLIDETPWDNWWSFNKERYLARPKQPIDADVRVKAVAALRALTNDPAPEVVAAALIGLARNGAGPAGENTNEPVSSFLPFVANPQRNVAEAVVIALGIVGGEGALPPLIALAHGTERGRELSAAGVVPDRSRAMAAYALGLAAADTQSDTRRERVVQTLAELVAQRPVLARAILVAAVNGIGIVPLPLVETTSAASALTTRRAQIEFLSHVYADSNIHYIVRAHVPAALANLLDGAPDALRVSVAELLLPALDKDSREKDEVRIGCVLALGRIGDCDADSIDARIRDALVVMSGHGDMQSENFTNIAFGQIGGRAGTGADSEKGRAFVRERLFWQLTKGRVRMQAWAALGLGILHRGLAAQGLAEDGKPSASVQALRAALSETPNPDRIGACSIALAIAGDTNSRAALKAKLAETSEPTARGFLALALSMLGADDARGSLRALAAESKSRIDFLSDAVVGLGLLGEPDTLPVLVDLLLEARGERSIAAAASAIALRGDVRALDPLIAISTRKDVPDRRRAYAVSVIGMLTDPRALPWNEVLSANVNYRASTDTLSTLNGAGILNFL